MEEVKCKVCFSNCKYNKEFTQFLALSDTECEIFSCGKCKTSFLVGDAPENIYNQEYFSVSGQEYSYEEQSTENHEHYQNILRKLVQLSGARRTIADVGCGLGHFIVEASREFQEVDGFDGFVDPEKVVCSPDKLTICDLDEVVFANEAYDSITLNHSLEHVNDPVRLLKQAFKGLRKGGVIYIEVPFQFYSLYDMVNGFLNPKKSPDFLSFHHKTFFTPSSLVLALKREGFKVMNVSTFLPKRGQKRYRTVKGKFMYLFLWLSSFFNKGDYISVFAKK